MTSLPLTLEERWRRYDAVEARLTASVSERMLDLAGVGPGMQVLDLATGRGEPALRAARRVGPTGQVLGVDLSEGVLRMAQEAADREGLSNLELRAANVDSLDGVPSGHFDAVTCRWGLMFMNAPVTALSRARAALSDTGVLVAALWAEPERMSYYALPRRFLPSEGKPPPPDPEAPGMFRYAKLDHIVRDFERAGLGIDHVEELDVAVFEAATGEEVVEYLRVLGGGMAALLDALPGEAQRAWRTAFLGALEQHRTDGMLRLGGVTRIVRARRA